ncbi:hypothetical protein AZE42_07049, partial [Rhizopogon vesiculosus]
ETSQQETHLSSLYPSCISVLSTSSDTTSILYPTSIALGKGNTSARTSSINTSDTVSSYRVRLIPHFDSLCFEPISRDLRDGDTPLLIGRFINIDLQAVNALATENITFQSEAVSWAHAEIWSDSSKINIKDTKSSGGTFVNHLRLSPADSESIPHQLEDGNVVQLGVDYQDVMGKVHKYVKFTIEMERESQAATDAFNSLSDRSSSSNPSTYLDTPARARSPSNYEEEENKGEEDKLRPMENEVQRNASTS